MTTLSTPVKLAGFLLALVVVFLGARGVGAVTSPVAEPAAPMAHDDMAGEDGSATATTRRTRRRPITRPVASRSPTRATRSGCSRSPMPGATGRSGSSIDDPDGHVVQVYDEVHEKPLHLIMVRRDGAGLRARPPDAERRRHLDRSTLDLAPGTNRLIADFTPSEGPELVLGTDVAGRRRLHAARRRRR